MMFMYKLNNNREICLPCDTSFKPNLIALPMHAVSIIYVDPEVFKVMDLLKEHLINLQIVLSAS